MGGRPGCMVGEAAREPGRVGEGGGGGAGSLWLRALLRWHDTLHDSQGQKSTELVLTKLNSWQCVGETATPGLPHAWAPAGAAGAATPTPTWHRPHCSMLLTTFLQHSHQNVNEMSKPWDLIACSCVILLPAGHHLTRECKAVTGGAHFLSEEGELSTSSGRGRKDRADSQNSSNGLREKGHE